MKRQKRSTGGETYSEGGATRGSREALEGAAGRRIPGRSIELPEDQSRGEFFRRLRIGRTITWARGQTREKKIHAGEGKRPAPKHRAHEH